MPRRRYIILSLLFSSTLIFGLLFSAILTNPINDPLPTLASINGISLPVSAESEPDDLPISMEVNAGQEIIIQFVDSASSTNLEQILIDLNAELVQEVPQINGAVLVSTEKITPQQLEILSSSIRIEPNYTVQSLLTFPTNDPMIGEQWALNAIDVASLWETSADMNITVAVIDSGVCFDHPDLQGRFLSNGFDFVDNDDDPTDEMGHGCAISGIIAATANNNLGITGVAPNVNILPIRVLDENGAGTYANVISAIYYAVNNGADIINLSLGGQNHSQILEQAVNYAIANGVAVVAGTGNTGQNGVFYPARYPSVIAVGSYDENGNRSTFSTYGNEVDTLAPGENILTTLLDGGYGYFSGTSMAVPHVSGLLALSRASGQPIDLANIVSTPAPPDGNMVEALGTGTPSATPSTPISSTSTPPTPISSTSTPTATNTPIFEPTPTDVPVSCDTTIGAGKSYDLINALQSAQTNPNINTICLTESVYTLSTSNNYGTGGFNGFPLITRDLTLVGNEASIVSTGSPGYRLFEILPDASLTIIGTKFDKANAGPSYGGMFYNDKGKLTLINSEFANSIATYGGVIYSYGGDVYITDSVFRDSEALTGGAIYSSGSYLENPESLTIFGSLFLRNTASRGGAIASTFDQSIYNSKFIGNEALINNAVFASYGSYPNLNFEDNCIYNNITVDKLASAGTASTIKRNWWGSPLGVDQNLLENLVSIGSRTEAHLDCLGADYQEIQTLTGETSIINLDSAVGGSPPYQYTDLTTPTDGALTGTHPNYEFIAGTTDQTLTYTVTDSGGYTAIGIVELILLPTTTAISSTPTATVPSLTPSITPTATATVPSLTPSITFTPSATFTPSITFTPSATFTPSITFTPSLTPSSTFTPTTTYTPTPTATPIGCSNYLNVYVVGSIQSDLEKDLRQAIECANQSLEDNTIDLNGQTVVFESAPAVYDLDGYNALQSIQTASTAGTLVIQNGMLARDSALSACDTTITDRTQFRLLHLSDGASVSLSNVVIRNGCVGNYTEFIVDRYGGGIYNYGGLTIINSRITLNWAYIGGGIWNANNGNIIITDSVIDNNSAGIGGGGINNRDNGQVTITNSTIRDNFAGNYGGGIVNTNYGKLTINGSILNGNISGNSGGGIYSNTTSTGQLTIIDSTLYDNQANESGGAITQHNDGPSTINNSTIYNNSSKYGGGFRLASSSSATIKNTTITQNSASFNGSGIYEQTSGVVTLINSIIANNVGGSDCNGTITFAGMNLIEDGSCNASSNGQLTGDPKLDSAGLQLNTGSMPTVPLLSDSPAIDVGDNTLAIGLTYDQRGVGYPRIYGAQVDLGAYEYQPILATNTPSPTITPTFAPSSTPSATFTPSSTPSATSTPLPTFTPQPLVPGGFTTLAVTDSSTSLSWIDPSAFELEYRLMRSTDNVNWSLLATLPADTESYIDATVSCETSYWYRLIAVYSTLESNPAELSVITSKCEVAIPDSVTTTLVSNQTTITWQPISIRQTTEIIIERAEQPADAIINLSNDWEVIVRLPGDMGIFTDDDLRCGMIYTYRMTGYNVTYNEYTEAGNFVQITSWTCPVPVTNTIGLYQDGLWMFRDGFDNSAPMITFRFGPQETGWIPLTGDWDGDGVDGIGLYKDGLFALRDVSDRGVTDYVYRFGNRESGWQPIVGDWDGDGQDTVGLYRDGVFMLTNTHGSSAVDYQFVFGNRESGWTAITGDWVASGRDFVGLYKDGVFQLHNSFRTQSTGQIFRFGPDTGNWIPIAGDWDKDGITTIGVYKDSGWRLRNSNSRGQVDIGLTFGNFAGTAYPLASYRGGEEAIQSLALSMTMPLSINPDSDTPPVPSLTATATQVSVTVVGSTPTVMVPVSETTQVDPTLTWTPTPEPTMLSTSTPLATETLEPTLIPTLEPTMLPTLTPLATEIIEPTLTPTEVTPESAIQEEVAEATEESSLGEK